MNERYKRLAQALYEFDPVVEQETDTVTGEPVGPADVITWADALDSYPATVEAIEEMALVVGKHLLENKNLPQPLVDATLGLDQYGIVETF
jgi:hypothetical protein